MVRLLPEQAERVETGPTRFGKDWTGVFIRGDNAAYYALHLRQALKHIEQSKLYDRAFVGLALKDLAELMESSNENRTTPFAIEGEGGTGQPIPLK